MAKTTQQLPQSGPIPAGFPFPALSIPRAFYYYRELKMLSVSSSNVKEFL
jgi:hypothetical protein